MQIFALFTYSVFPEQMENLCSYFFNKDIKSAKSKKRKILRPIAVEILFLQ
jgi:hypothetical protein